VLLDKWHVLTCAHVVRQAGGDDPEGRVVIRSSVCRPEWAVTARVAPDSWVHRGATRRGDVALLRFDEPSPCDTSTQLWRAPVSGVRVSVYGFPRAAGGDGISTEAVLAGSGGRQGEWVQLNPVGSGLPWIDEGFSGAGVAPVDGEFQGRVIGIVVMHFANDKAGTAARMLSTETILEYLPGIDHLGERANTLSPLDVDTGVPPDSVQLALTRELARFLGSGRTGTVVVAGGGSGVGGAWLARLGRAGPRRRRRPGPPVRFRRCRRTGRPRRRPWRSRRGWPRAGPGVPSEY
jgi:hypothetical protein